MHVTWFEISVFLPQFCFPFFPREPLDDFWRGVEPSRNDNSTCIFIEKKQANGSAAPVLRISFKFLGNFIKKDALQMKIIEKVVRVKKSQPRRSCESPRKRVKSVPPERKNLAMVGLT